MGAKEYEARTEHGEGFITASGLDQRSVTRAAGGPRPLIHRTTERSSSPKYAFSILDSRGPMRYASPEALSSATSK
jgi:hypothetical protein